MPSKPLQISPYMQTLDKSLIENFIQYHTYTKNKCEEFLRINPKILFIPLQFQLITKIKQLLKAEDHNEYLTCRKEIEEIRKKYAEVSAEIAYDSKHNMTDEVFKGFMDGALERRDDCEKDVCMFDRHINKS